MTTDPQVRQLAELISTRFFEHLADSDATLLRQEIAAVAGHAYDAGRREALREAAEIARDSVRNAFLYGARFGYEHANSDRDLRRTLDEAEKWIYQFEKTEPAAVPSHVSPEPLSAEQIADEWEDCGSLACTILDVKLERVTFGPEGMAMDCETAKAIANTVIKRLRKDAYP